MEKKYYKQKCSRCFQMTDEQFVRMIFPETSKLKRKLIFVEKRHVFYFPSFHIIGYLIWHCLDRVDSLFTRFDCVFIHIYLQNLESMGYFSLFFLNKFVAWLKFIHLVFKFGNTHATHFVFKIWSSHSNFFIFEFVTSVQKQQKTTIRFFY